MSGSFLGINQLCFLETLKLTLKELLDILVHTLFAFLPLYVNCDADEQPVTVAQLSIQIGKTDEEVI